MASPVGDFVLTPAERTLFGALHTRGVRFIVVGMSAAVLEGAPVIASKRATNRFKDQASLPILEATLVAKNDHREE